MLASLFLTAAHFAVSLPQAKPFHGELPKESMALCTGSSRWLKTHPAQFLVLVASCFNYSFLGFYIMYCHREIQPTAFPFSLTQNGVLYLGMSIVLQGLASFMGDIYSPYHLGTIQSKWSYLDITMALTNVSTALSSFCGRKCQYSQ